MIVKEASSVPSAVSHLLWSWRNAHYQNNDTQIKIKACLFCNVHVRHQQLCSWNPSTRTHFWFLFDICNVSCYPLVMGCEPVLHAGTHAVDFRRDTVDMSLSIFRKCAVVSPNKNKWQRTFSLTKIKTFLS